VITDAGFEVMEIFIEKKRKTKNKLLFGWSLDGMGFIWL
jgi:hypothetical protein